MREEEERMLVIKVVATAVITTVAMLVAVLLVTCIGASMELVMHYVAQHALRMPIPFLMALCAVVVPCAAGAGAFSILWKQLKKLIQL